MKQKLSFFLLSVVLSEIISSPTFAAAVSATPSANQHAMNLTYWFLILINAVFFTGIFVAMAYYIFKNRKGGLDMIWSMLPAMILLVLVSFGWSSFRDQHLNEGVFYAFKISR